MSFCFHTIANILTKVKSVTANDIIIIIKKKAAGVVNIFYLFWSYIKHQVFWSQPIN